MWVGYGLWTADCVERNDHGIQIEKNQKDLHVYRSLIDRLDRFKSKFQHFEWFIEIKDLLLNCKQSSVTVNISGRLQNANFSITLNFCLGFGIPSFLGQHSLSSNDFEWRQKNQGWYETVINILLPHLSISGTFSMDLSAPKNGSSTLPPISLLFLPITQSNLNQMTSSI